MASQEFEFDRSEWNHLFEMENPWKRQWFTDEEAAFACGLSIRGLRLAQTHGFIRAVVAKRSRGAQIRMWSSEDVLRASLVAGVTNFGGFSVLTAVRLLKLVQKEVIDDLVGQTAPLVEECADEPESLVTDYGWLERSKRRVMSELGDIGLVIVDRRYVFLEGRFPELLEDAEPGTEVRLVGLVSDVYSRDPFMRRVPGLPSASVADRLKDIFDNPISTHRINLELALRWRIAKALKLKVSR